MGDQATKGKQYVEVDFSQDDPRRRAFEARDWS
jgi:hypothetical protein